MNLKDYCSFLKEAGVADPRRYLREFPAVSYSRRQEAR